TAFPSFRSDDKGKSRYLRAGTGAPCGEMVTDRSRYHFPLSASGALSAAPVRQATSTKIAGHANLSAQTLRHGNMKASHRDNVSGVRSVLHGLVELPDVERFGGRDFRQ